VPLDEKGRLFSLYKAGRDQPAAWLHRVGHRERWRLLVKQWNPILGIGKRHVMSTDDEEMMKQLNRTLLVGALALVVGCSQPASNMVPSVPNGVQVPQGYQDWRVIASSHRTDKNSLRVILGNDIAI
jgi:hypothetical protein